MATIFVDGFDNYGPPGIVQLNLQNTGLPQGGWTVLQPSSQIALSIVASLNGQTGYGISLVSQTLGAVATMTKGLQKNYARVIGGLRFLAAQQLEGYSSFAFGDNTTTQLTLAVAPISGVIEIWLGSAGIGTLLGVTTKSVAGNTEHYLEFDLTFAANNAGGWTVWLDGVQVLAGTGITSVSGNAYANQMQIGTLVGVAYPSIQTVDDIYLFDDTTAFNNAVVLANPVVLTDAPIADAQKQFTNLGNIVGNSFSIQGGSATANANSLWLTPVVPNVGCTLRSVAVQLDGSSGNSSTAQFQGVVYADSAGAPGALLSAGSQITGFTSGEQLDLPLASPTALTATTQYWIGFINDTSVPVNYAAPTGTLLYRTVANTYASGAPASAPTMTVGSMPIFIYGLCTGAVTNWQSEAVVPPVGDASAVSSAAVGAEDLYTFPALPNNVQAVYTVSVSGSVRLTGSGAHKFNMVAKSGTATGAGNNTNISPTVTYAWYDSPIDTDPNTTLAWTPAAVALASFGMTVTT